MTDKQKSPEEIVAWLEREIAPQRLPGRVKIQLTDMLRDRDASWEKRVGLPSEDECEAAIDAANHALRDPQAIAAWRVGFREGFAWFRTHLSKAQLAALLPSIEKQQAALRDMFIHPDSAKFANDGANWLRSQVKLVDVGELVEALEFYSEEAHWNDETYSKREEADDLGFYTNDAEQDAGKRARAALAKFREGK